MDRQYLSRVMIYLLLGLFALAIICELCYQFYDSVYESVETLDAVKKSLCKTADGIGYIVRDEKAVDIAPDGGCMYLARDGEKVNKGQTVAAVYDETKADAETIDRINRLNDEINCLTQAQTLAGGYSVVSVETAIEGLRMQIAAAASAGDAKKASETADELSVMLAVSEIVHGKVKNYKQRITDVTAERDQLITSLGTVKSEISSPLTGFFYSRADGYEEAVIPDSLDEITFDECDRAFLSVKSEDNRRNVSACKTVSSFKWYVICMVDADEAVRFVTGKEYTVFLGQTKTQMELYRSIESGDGKRLALIFESDVIPAEFDFARLQSVSVVCEETEGYEIPAEAVRYVNGVPGVYVLRGSVVEYREIKSVHSENGMFFSEDGFEASKGQTALSFYDLIIVRGKELYVGKIIS